MRKILILVFLTRFSFGFSQNDTNHMVAVLSQMKADTSKVNHYYKLAENFSIIDTTKSTYFAQKGRELAQQIKWNDGLIQFDLLIGKSYARKNNYTKSFLYYKQVIQKTKNKNILAKAYFYSGENYLQQNLYAVALKAFHQSLNLYETLQDKTGITRVLLSIGTLYTGFGKNKEALESHTKALKLSQQNNNLLQELALRGMATVYYNTGDYQKSLVFFEKSLALIQKGNDRILESRLLSDIALVYLELGNYQKGINYSQASLKTDPSVMNNIHSVAFSYGVIGDSYVELAREKNNNPILIDSAITYLEKAVDLHQKFKSLRGLQDDYRSIYEAYKLQGNPTKALESYELFTIYKDSMYNSDNKETIKNLEDKRAIELRDREIKINKLQLEAKEKQKWFFIFGLVLLGIIGGLLFYQNQNRTKTNKKLHVLNTDLDQKNKALDEANKTNARFFAILNHDLRSPVYNLIHFLQLQKENPELLDKETKTSIQNKTMTAAENLLQSMEDLLLWSKSQMEHFQPQPQTLEIATVFEDTQKHFSSLEKIQFHFENASNLSVVTDENYLKTIVRNLTGNAIKALDKVDNPTITWKALQENGKTILSITDNGKGATIDEFKALYDEKEVVGIKTGLGLHLIRDLAKAIDCTISVDSKLHQGTTITLKL